MASCADGNATAVCPAPTSWCTVESTCNAHLKECIPWPRCRTPPFLGCAADAQQCIDTSLWPNATHQMANVLQRTDVSLSISVVVIILVLIIVGVAVFMGCHVSRFFRFAKPQRNIP